MDRQLLAEALVEAAPLHHSVVVLAADTAAQRDLADFAALADMSARSNWALVDMVRKAFDMQAATRAILELVLAEVPAVVRLANRLRMGSAYFAELLAEMDTAI